MPSTAEMREYAFHPSCVTFDPGYASRSLRIALIVPGITRKRPVDGFEIAAIALQSDSDLGLRLEGGEGDCVELSREDFMRVREAGVITML